MHGHRLLPADDGIRDGRQPSGLGDLYIGIVFNGAIYNFRELRADLERSGCRFNSHTDTEVLIHGYRVERAKNETITAAKELTPVVA